MGTLSPGDVVVWSGAPRRGPVFAPGTGKLLAIPGVGVVLVVLAYFFLPDVFWLCMLITLWGLVESVGLPLVRAFTLRRTVYTVTDQRLLISTGIQRSTSRANLVEPTVTAGPDGVGDLFFFGADGPVRFRNIEDAHRVRDLIAESWADDPA
ncbi:MAG: hypothetical protein QOI21_4939 [Actinomycetota bacterium]|jgi:hypothetical protein|nr:hypothetical protein [Actinomycetota bacterium]